MNMALIRLTNSGSVERFEKSDAEEARGEKARTSPMSLERVLRQASQAIRDKILVLRCQAGDRDAFAELVHERELRLFYFIRRLVPHEADAWDVLQKTWVHVLRDIGKLRNPAALQTWLYRLARNTAVTHYRRESIVQADPADGIEIEDETSANDTLLIENVEQVHVALNQLRPLFQEVLVLHFLEEMTTEEIAVVLGIPSGTVKSRLHHGKRALTAIIENENGGRK